MKTCQECGTKVNDNELVCPCCGATVVMHVSGLSLKNSSGAPKKKPSSSLNMSVSQDFLDVEQPFVVTSKSIPKTKEKEEKSYSVRGKSTFFPKLIKFILFVAIAYGIYTAITTYLVKDNGVTDRDTAYNIYIEAIKNPTVDNSELKKLIPPYEKESHFMQSKYINIAEGDTIFKADVTNKRVFSDNEVDRLVTDIKLATGNTPKIREAGSYDLRYVTKKGTLIEQTVTFVKIRNSWYLDTVVTKEAE